MNSPGSTAEEQVFRSFQQVSDNNKDINILLLGETGVGKSTFINSFANYLEYDKFDIAEKNRVRCLIPAKFTVTNENFEERIVQIGCDTNENNTIYQSAKLETRSYVFPISKSGIGRVRLIDTPGIADVSGIDRDNENMENILSYISLLKNLHAICFLLKPNNTRLTLMFHYCIKQLLSRLEKSASKNIIFVFTHTRSSFYKPGDTTTALKRILNDIKQNPPYAEIKFAKDNVFCLDNESFRYLVATKNNIMFGNRESFVDSWRHSVQECWRLLHFITGKGESDMKIVPHKVKDTMPVNEARRVILQLSQPLADIADIINDSMKVLERHNRSLRTDNQSITELKKNLYVPVVNLRCKELSQPTTVCTARNCEINTDKEVAAQEIQKLNDEIRTIKANYVKEKDAIIKMIAKFVHSSQRNTAPPYNDSCKAYIEELIDRENSLGADCDYDALRYYKDFLKCYNEKKRILNESAQSETNSSEIGNSILDSVHNSNKLSHSVKNISQSHIKQLQTRETERQNTETVLEKSTRSVERTKKTFFNDTTTKNKSKALKNKVKLNEKEQTQKNDKNKSSKSNSKRKSNMHDAVQYQHNEGRFVYSPPLPPCQCQQGPQYGKSQNRFNNSVTEQGYFSKEQKNSKTNIESTQTDNNAFEDDNILSYIIYIYDNGADKNSSNRKNPIKLDGK